MSIERGLPREEPSRQEQTLMKRLDRVRKLFGFLRVQRRQWFDDAFGDELAAMYRDSGAGKSPVPPALMVCHPIPNVAALTHASSSQAAPRKTVGKPRSSFRAADTLDVMPRWETRTAKKESFVELLVDGDRLWVAEGRREPGATEWSVDHSHPKEIRFNAGAEAAQAEYDKRVAKLPKSTQRVAEATPIITPARDRRLAERADLLESMRAWEAEHGLVARLEKDGVVRLVGQKDSNRDEYYEIAIEDTSVVVRRGKLAGGKPKTEREDEPDRPRALQNAQIKLMTATGILKFGVG